MQLEPAGRFEWERALEQVDLPRHLKATAYRLPMYGSSDGTNIHPGESRLATALGLTKRTVRRHLRELRALGVVERVAEGGGNQFGKWADDYRLTLPDDLLERFGSRLPDGSHRTPVSGTEVRHRTPMTGSEGTNDVRSRTPVSGSETLLASSYRSPDVAVPDTRRPRYRTPVSAHQGSTKDVHQGENSGFSCDVAKEEGESYPLKAEPDSISNGKGPGFDYASASAFLLTLSDYGAEAVAQAETELGDGADRADVITRAASIARRAA
ncbi:MAG: winged helix-turn-helix domain-containing protein [Micromonosporaceae bacterium]